MIKDDDKKNKLDTSRKLAYRNIKFKRIDFSFKTEQFNEDTTGSFKDNFDMHISWILTARRNDRKGAIISCDLRLISKNLEIILMIQTKMRFDKELSDKEVFESTSLQKLSANLFFPYLIEVISSNTVRMGISPITLDYSTLDRIIEKTDRQGGFVKKKQ